MRPAFFNSHPRIPFLVGLMLIQMALVGCQKKPTHERIATEGKVTLNGKPLEFGSILFVPKAGNSGPKAGGTIHRGKYQIPQQEGPTAGELEVKIYSPRFAAGESLPEDIEELKKIAAHASELLPAEYNAKTTLSVIAKKDGPNRFDFDLEMTPR